MNEISAETKWQHEYTLSDYTREAIIERCEVPPGHSGAAGCGHVLCCKVLGETMVKPGCFNLLVISLSLKVCWTFFEHYTYIYIYNQFFFMYFPLTHSVSFFFYIFWCRYRPCVLKGTVWDGDVATLLDWRGLSTTRIWIVSCERYKACHNASFFKLAKWFSSYHMWRLCG